MNALVNLAILEIETEAGEEAGRLLGRVLVELETGGDDQLAVPAYQATASFALWSGDLADARRAAERGWARVKGSEDWVLIARMAATSMEVEAAIVAEALVKRRIGDVAASRERASRIMAEAESAVARARAEDPDGARREPEASLATGARVPRPAPRARRSRALGGPRGALARARRAVPGGEGPLAPGRGDHERRGRGTRRRADATRASSVPRPASRLPRRWRSRCSSTPGRCCASCASSRAGRSSRCRPTSTRCSSEPAPAPAERPPPDGVAGPVADGAGPPARIGRPGAGWAGDTFGLSKRELEVLALIAQGRTNREIGDRLFISQKTVGVHVGNILAKLGVSGRVEAAAVAIRLGLEEGGRRPA